MLPVTTCSDDQIARQSKHTFLSVVERRASARTRGSKIRGRWKKWAFWGRARDACLPL